MIEDFEAKADELQRNSVLRRICAGPDITHVTQEIENKVDIVLEAEKHLRILQERAETQGKVGMSDITSPSNYEALKSVQEKSNGVLVAEVKALQLGDTNALPGRALTQTIIERGIRILMERADILYNRVRHGQFEQGRGNYEVILHQGLIASVFAENASRTASDAAALESLSLQPKTLGVDTRATTRLQKFASFNVQQFLLEGAARAFMKKLDQQILLGVGGNEATGVNNVTAYPGQPLGTATGLNNVIEVTSATAGAIDVNSIIQTEVSISPEYRDDAVFVMNASTYVTLFSVLNSGQATRYWPLDFSEGSTRILGHPCYINNNMPNITSGSVPILFGDFNQYLLMETIGVDIEVDYLSSPQYYQYHITKYFDGGMVDGNAFVRLKIS